jgi:nucleoid-associated protein YgaU
MGLFSFLKNAGSKILRDKAEENNSKKEAINKNREKALEHKVLNSGIQVENLEIELQGDQVTVYGHTSSQANREKIILLLGNVQGIAEVDDRISVVNTEAEATFYTVESGDSLSKIAKSHYGDALKYMVIFEANQPLLEDPNKIYPGQVLRIPTI